MPSFVTRVAITFRDGERVEIETNGQDQINAERAIGGTITEHMAEMGMRVWYCALRRSWPDHPASKNFRTFVDTIRRGDELDERDEDDSLDPTRPAASGA